MNQHRSILHVTNGDSARLVMERAGIPGTVLAWPDVLHEGPVQLVSRDAWVDLRSRYLASVGDGDAGEMIARYRATDDRLEAYADYDEVVFWFEHDLFDQLLLIRQLWWVGQKYETQSAGAPRSATRFSLVCTDRYLGMLQPNDFPALFAARQAIVDEEIGLGTRAWLAFTNADPTGLLPLAAAVPSPLPYLAAAVRRHLEEFPSTENGLARSERQILRVLSEGMRSPDETFIEASRYEEAIFMGDTSFWTIVKRLTEGPRPLLAADLQPRPGRLPEGTLALNADGAAVLSGRADHVALNGIDRWLGGVHLTPGRQWRWTGTTLREA